MDTNFSEKINNLIENIAILKKKFNQISTIRLISFLIFSSMILYGFFQKNLFYILFSLLFLGVFLFMIFRHNKLEYQLKHDTTLVEVLEHHQNRLNGKWHSFKNTGSQFMDDQHAFTSDLDIFGPNSLYQYLCTANTYFGIQQLGSLLKKPQTTLQESLLRQEAVRELAKNFSFCTELECAGIFMQEESQKNNSRYQSELDYYEKSSPEQFLQYAEIRGKQYRNPLFKLFCSSLPLLTISFWIILFFYHSFPLVIPIITTAFQLFFVWFAHNKVFTSLKTVYLIRDRIATYKQLISQIEQHNFKSSLLNHYKDNLFNENDSASKQLLILEHITDAIDVRNVPIIYFILNSVFLWDYHCVFLLENWKSTHGENIRKWLNTIGFFETLSAITVMPFLHSDWVFPKYSNNNELRLDIKGTGHPLIEKEKLVINDFVMSENIIIITGSNMSGKTTFLRTVGLNMILAYLGSSVCASYFLCPIVNIYTSMRIKDDISEGISTFYAELIRIKKIVDAAIQNPPLLFLMDEILKGTNSEDRIAGATAVIRKLCSRNVFGLISTHDFELCGLEKNTNGKVVNYHFIEHYINDQIQFDYKLRSGMCTSTNAQQLMKMMGLLD